jgi:hypothetical protein
MLMFDWLLPTALIQEFCELVFFFFFHYAFPYSDFYIIGFEKPCQIFLRIVREAKKIYKRPVARPYRQNEHRIFVHLLLCTLSKASSTFIQATCNEADNKY